MNKLIIFGLFTLSSLVYSAEKPMDLSEDNKKTGPVLDLELKTSSDSKKSLEAEDIKIKITNSSGFRIAFAFYGFSSAIIVEPEGVFIPTQKQLRDLYNTHGHIFISTSFETSIHIGSIYINKNNFLLVNVGDKYDSELINFGRDVIFKRDNSGHIVLSYVGGKTIWNTKDNIYKSKEKYGSEDSEEDFDDK